MRETNIVPQVNQIEVHPYFNQQEVQDFCDKHDIACYCMDAINEKQRIVRRSYYNKTSKSV